MAYLTKTHHLCETPKLICKRLAGREECWEKRWATMLSGWQRSRDLHWEDLPSFPYTGVTSWSMLRLADPRPSTLTQDD